MNQSATGGVERNQSVAKADLSEAVASRAFAPGIVHRAGAAVYDTGAAWVTVGALGVGPELVSAAAECGRRLVFFGTERQLPQTHAIAVGLQPFFERDHWLAQRGLREQVRRAGRKGVRVRRVEADELVPRAPMRLQLEALTDEWLADRRMEPMGFVVKADPVRAWDPQLQLAAEVNGVLVGFLSAVFLPASSTWMVEHILRSPAAPNGCAEAMLDALFAAIAPSEHVTLGLAPLAGDARWQRWIRWLTRPLYDFDGLYFFKQRLHPSRWQPVWIAYPPKRTVLGAILDCLRAFAEQPLWKFALRTVWNRTGAAAFALAAPLVPWTIFLLGLAASGKIGPLGFSGPALWGWSLFDGVLIAGMLQAARHPRPRLLALLWTAATLDACVSVTHLATAGWGDGPMHAIVRLLGTSAPLLATLLLGRATWRSIVRARRQTR